MLNQLGRAFSGLSIQPQQASATRGERQLETDSSSARCSFAKTGVSRSNKKPAFTFIEVLIALGILTATVAIVSNLEMRAIFRVMRDRDAIGKIFLLKKNLYNYYFKKPDPKQKRKQVIRLEEPEIKMTTELIDIQKKSTLKDFAKKIQIVKTTGEWKQEDEERRADMITLVLRPPEKKKDKR